MNQSLLKTTSPEGLQTPEAILGAAFLLNFPRESARKLEALSPVDAAEILQNQPINASISVWNHLSPVSADAIIPYFSKDQATKLLEALDPNISAAVLGRMNEEDQEKYLFVLDKGIAKELRDLLVFPAGSVGSLMDTKITAFNKKITIEDALSQLKSHGTKLLDHLFLLDDSMQLCGHVDIHKLALADGSQTLAALSEPIKAYLNALDPKEEAIYMAEKNNIEKIPVVDGDHRLMGLLQRVDLITAMKEDLASNMQTMVGVSKEERALSSSLFAVRKRLPWLQINLLTAFLASAVVGAFESTIAQFTALAVLLPVAAGQSGNTGAQALAVTMRGLTLREVTLRHWFRVIKKECAAGFINGIAIALTCAAGVYIWSQSFGLALVMALAMIISMTLAGASGAMVPMVLKRLGQDPAASSSIILTTITDIAGFMSFLGIATLLSGML